MYEKLLHLTFSMLPYLYSHRASFDWYYQDQQIIFMFIWRICFEMNVKVWYIIKTTISKQHKYEKVVHIVGSATLQATIPPAKKNLSQFSIVIMHVWQKV